MKRPRLPTLPAVLDDKDRRVLGVGLSIAMIIMLVLIVGAAIVGLSVRVFLLASGIGG